MFCLMLSLLFIIIGPGKMDFSFYSGLINNIAFAWIMVLKVNIINETYTIRVIYVQIVLIIIKMLFC